MGPLFEAKDFYDQIKSIYNACKGTYKVGEGIYKAGKYISEKNESDDSNKKDSTNSSSQSSGGCGMLAIFIFILLGGLIVSMGKWDGLTGASKQTARQLNGNSTTVSPNNPISIDVSNHTITERDLQGLSKSNLRILRNEIFARHGYIFTSKDLQDHFSAKEWYKPRYKDATYVSNLLNPIERKNVEFIKKYE